MVHGQYIRFATPLLISIYQKWWHCFVNKSLSLHGRRAVIKLIYYNLQERSNIYTWLIERPFLAAQSFNTNLVQCLPPYFVIIINMHVCSFMCTISHVHMRAPKTVLHAQNLLYKKNMTHEDLLWFLFPKLQTTV